MVGPPILGLRAFLRGETADVAAIRTAPPLPETADELCAVGRTLGADRNNILLGARANERALAALSASGELKHYRIIHFATHGLLASDTAAVARIAPEPALLLTPPEIASEADDGLLTASEIARLDLAADWVILSACNTSAGETDGGETLSGLGRAFFYAGARALLVSHWPVDSQAAVKLVTHTLAQLASDRSIGRAEALRRSMQSLIETGTTQEAHPAYWAPFVVVGDDAGTPGAAPVPPAPVSAHAPRPGIRPAQSGKLKSHTPTWQEELWRH